MPLELILQIPFYILGGVLVIFYLFIDRTPKYRIPIFIFMVLWAFAVVAEKTVIDFGYLSTICIGLAAIGYFLRFKSYENKDLLDWIKLGLVTSVVVIEAVDNDILFTIISILLLSFYVIDKTTFNLELSNKWKTILMIPFVLSISAEIASSEILWKKHTELIDDYMEEMEKRQKLQSELVNCDLEKKILDQELTQRD